MRITRWGLLAIVALTQPGAAGDELPSVDRRLDARPEETPSFQRHVLPLFSRLGCNGRACHGSFQGQGDFRLSLFGYDFKSDHDALAAGEEPRVLTRDPLKSRLLLKPTKAIAHKGGKLIETDGWQHRLLLRWIKAGAPPANEADALLTLEVQPREIVFRKPGEAGTLKVVAHWADGTREDVTPLSRFRTNDESIATVDAAGTVTAVGKGDTHVVAFYDNGVAPVHVLLPATDRTGPRFPDVPTPTRVDQLVVEKLRKLGVVPSGLCSDAEFLRRVSLDMTGTLPSAAEARAFLADSRADKRARKIDELLERPAYAAWWATRLCDLTGNSPRTGPQGSEQALNAEKSRQWYQWIYRRVRENVPYDDLIEGIALAVGKTLDQTYDQYCAEMSSYFRKEKPVDFSARSTMPYFWTRRNVGSAEAKALSFANAFLGLSLQCAQCHKHPYDQWTKQDFDQFTAFFSEVKYNAGPRERMKQMYQAVKLEGDEDDGAFKRKFMDLVGQGKVLPFKELVVPGRSKAAPKARRPNPKLGRVITPKLLGGDEVVALKDDPRQPVMDWMRQADNPYFATAWVNRVWANYLGKGLIEPTDDLNLANPPSHPALLDHLAQGFIKSGYDMKWLHREIANSRTYQLSRQANETNAHDERNFSRAVIRRLHAEATVDALNLATLSDDARKALDLDPLPGRAIGLLGNVGGGRRDETAYSLNLFGKPPREINCDCERSAEPSLLQTVYLRNDAEVLKMLDRKDGWLHQVKGRDRAAVVEEAFLRTLSRPPTAREKAVAMGQDPRDLMWALLNTKEFILNH